MISQNERLQFLQQYKEWSEQEKYQDFSFIKKVTPKWEERIKNDEKMNVWAFIFGPLYIMPINFLLGILLFFVYFALIFSLVGFFGFSSNDIAFLFLSNSTTPNLFGSFT